MCYTRVTIGGAGLPAHLTQSEVTREECEVFLPPLEPGRPGGSMARSSCPTVLPKETRAEIMAPQLGLTKSAAAGLFSPHTLERREEI